MSTCTIAWALLVSATAAPPVEPVIYQLQVDVRGAVKGRVSINGVDLSDLPEHGTFGAPLNLWLKQGKNEILLELEKGTRPVGAGDGIELQILRAKLGEPLDGRPPVVELAWKGTDPLPSSRRGRFDLTGGPTTELWTRAEVVPFYDTAKKAATDLVRKLHEAIAKRDAKTAGELSAFKIRDMLRLLGANPNDALARSTAEFQSAFAGLSKGASPRPFDPTTLRFAPQAGGRFVRVTSRDGRPPIVIEESDHLQAFEVSVARLDGAWMIVR